MRKSSLIILIALLSISIKVFPVGNEQKNDTMMYFEIDIRSNTSYSIVMSGLIKKFDYSNLSINNVESFIESFYRQGYFVPNFLIYDAALKECIKLNGDSTLLKYIGQGQRLMNLIAGHGREFKIILESGENVYIKITEISGIFLYCSKGEVQLPSVSNEIPINDVGEIKKIYLPLEIYGYNKLSRKCIREMFK